MDKKIKFCLFDFDGTLLNNKKVVFKSSLNAIKILRKHKVKIGIATGRPFYMSKDIIDMINPELPTISINGATITDRHGKTIYQKTWDPINTKKVIAWLKKYGYNFLCYGDKIMYYSCAYDSPRLDWLKKINHSAKNKWQLLPIKNIHNNNILKILITDLNNKKDLLIKAKKFINEIKSLYVVQSQSGVMDIMCREVTKGNAMIILHDKGIINKDYTIVFGDAMNDVSMFKYAKLSIAMGNACNKTKNKADIVIGSNNDHSIYHYIKEYFHEY